LKDDVSTLANHQLKKLQVSSDDVLPVVQMHGMGDFAKDPFGMVPLANAISDYLGGVYVLNVQIGNSSIADILNGFLMNLDDQVDYFASVVQNDNHLIQGFNAIGYSQGNLVIRGYIERYNNPPVKNFISMHGPLAGVGSFPNCPIEKPFCRLFAEILGLLAYHPKVQDHLAQANYYRDPYRTEEFLSIARFLPDINNEDDSKNSSYSSQWSSLESVCLVKALSDTVVIPKDSEWFGFFQENSFKDIWDFSETPWYLNDLFGLQTLNKAGKVYFNTTDDNHLEFETDYLLELVGLYFT
jgi:palmitoyl-protein thioesterase